MMRLDVAIHELLRNTYVSCGRIIGNPHANMSMLGREDIRTVAFASHQGFLASAITLSNRQWEPRCHPTSTIDSCTRSHWPHQARGSGVTMIWSETIDVPMAHVAQRCHVLA